MLRQNDQAAGADDLLRPILDLPAFASDPSLWRLGALLAEKRNQSNRAVECLERAVDLEYDHLPDVVNLQAIERVTYYGDRLYRVRLRDRASTEITASRAGAARLAAVLKTQR